MGKFLTGKRALAIAQKVNQSQSGRIVQYEPRPFPNANGTHDANGKFILQCVHEGITQSGQYGLFTGHYLAWPLTEMEYHHFISLSFGARSVYCRRLGFGYDGE